jgi:arginine deiminase
MVYRPGSEIKKITDTNFKEMGFRDVPHYKNFLKEHDYFIDLLRDENVEVILINDILKEVDDFPPNMVFVRDSGSVTKRGYIKMNLKLKIRKRESNLISNAFKQCGIPEFFSTESSAIVEGGDFVYPNSNSLMLGYGPRTNKSGILQISKRMIDGGIINNVLSVLLPDWRVHLDGGLMFVEKDVVLYHPRSIENQPSQIIRKNEAAETIDIRKFLINEYGAELISINDNEVLGFGTNVICLGGQKCIIYDKNERIIKELKERGIDAIPISGSELSQGGGGPHCMTLPILRKS